MFVYKAATWETVHINNNRSLMFVPHGVPTYLLFEFVRFGIFRLSPILIHNKCAQLYLYLTVIKIFINWFVFIIIPNGYLNKSNTRLIMLVKPNRMRLYYTIIHYTIL